MSELADQYREEFLGSDRPLGQLMIASRVTENVKSLIVIYDDGLYFQRILTDNKFTDSSKWISILHSNGELVMLKTDIESFNLSRF